MGSQGQHRGKAAQNKSENITARELLGSQVQHRGGAAKTSRKTSSRGSLMGSKVQHRGGAAQSKPEDTTAREVNGQHKSQKCSGYPKYEQKTSREGV